MKLLQGHFVPGHRSSARRSSHLGRLGTVFWSPDGTWAKAMETNLYALNRWVIMPGTSPHPQLPIPEEMQRHGGMGRCWRGRIWMELNGYELIWAWTCCISYIEEATKFRSRFNSRGINKINTGNGLKHHYYFSSFLASCRLAKPFAKSKCSLFCRRCKGTLAFVHALCYCRRAEMPTASHECSFSELMNSATCQQSTGRMKMSMMLND